MAELDNLCMGCMSALPEGESICPHCKFDASSENPESALKLRTVLEGRYIVGKMLSQNGEGITYLGYDAENNLPVRIREYCPAGISQRTRQSVLPITGKEELFAHQLQKFLELARSLARMRGLSAIFPVYDIFEAGSTAYYISETNECITLRDFLLRNGSKLTYDQARPLFMPILSTLNSLHAVGIIHRGISPETLVISKDGRIRLTEFCVEDVRSARSEMVPQLFKGYAALEQYGFEGEQGPWTDIYGLAATLYRTIVGNPPPEATSRVTNDKLIMPPSVAETLPAYVMQALINALAILPQERTQSVETFRDELSAAPNIISKQEHIKTRPERQQNKKKKSGNKKYAIVSIAAAVVIIGTILILVLSNIFGSDEPSPEEMLPTMQTTTAPDYSYLYIDVNSGTVPNLVGQDYATLISSADPTIIEMLEFYDDISIIRKEYNDDVPAGTIISQTPAQGKKSSKGDVIKVVVSLGKEKFEMPDVVDMEEKDAIIALMRFGFRYENITIVERYDAKASPRAVLETDPEEGTEIIADMKITVYVNSVAEEVTTVTTTKPKTTAKPRTTTKPRTTAKPHTAPTTHATTPAPTTHATTQAATQPTTQAATQPTTQAATHESTQSFSN
jgi:serine/threonine protein kinase